MLGVIAKAASARRRNLHAGTVPPVVQVPVEIRVKPVEFRLPLVHLLSTVHLEHRTAEAQGRLAPPPGVRSAEERSIQPSGFPQRLR